MFKNMMHVLRGYILWKWMCFQLRIHYKKVVLVLVNENQKMDYFALIHLNDFMRRKCVKNAWILYCDKKTEKMAQQFTSKKHVKCRFYPEDKIKLLYDYYTFEKFFDNIVFTYTDCPADNLLGKVMQENGISEEEAVCLCLYHLRSVPPVKRQSGERTYV